MECNSKVGARQIPENCRYSLSAVGMVGRIFADLVTIPVDVGLMVEEMA